KIEVGLGAHSPSVVVRRGQVLSGRKTVVVRKLPPPEVASGMGIHRNDRLYRDLEKAVYPDEARIDRAGRFSGERPPRRTSHRGRLLLLLLQLLSDAPVGRQCPTI